MSYILEALRKSQQERELGHVPTLETPVFPSGEAGARPNIWIPLAVFLAALAVAIALYSALRDGAPTPDPAEPMASGADTDAPESFVRAPTLPVRPPAQPVAPPPAAAASGPQQPKTKSPAPKAADPKPVEPAVVMEAPAAPAEPRQSIPEPPAASPPPESPTRASTNKIPPDLIADIEAFKREIRDVQSDAGDTARTEDEVSPRDLRLPKDVRNRLPEFVMSAHIFDEDPPKRFVLINGLKTREGEESREEITVEQILPDGAVLSFDGHRFFQHR